MTPEGTVTFVNTLERRSYIYRWRFGDVSEGGLRMLLGVDSKRLDSANGNDVLQTSWIEAAPTTIRGSGSRNIDIAIRVDDGHTN